MKRTMRVTAGVLAACCLPLHGCSSLTARDWMQGVKAEPMIHELTTEEEWDNLADFGVKLLQNTEGGEENTLIAPLSVLCALAMTANGAKGETLAQMEQTLGAPVERLNHGIHALMGEEREGLYLANSIWFSQRDSFTVNQEFLQTNATYYGAGVYEAPFDHSTVDDINRWVKEETHGMIEGILDEIPQDAAMYLVNALAFEAQWESVYTQDDVWEGVFTNDVGESQQVEMMGSMEHMFLQDDGATGFVKPYAGGKYAFVALLPKEGTTVEAYINTLTGAHLREMLRQRTDTSVVATMPKFESDGDVKLNQALEHMGISLAFDGDGADLSGLGTDTQGNLFISRVLHKTYISVAEQGTRAGAATAVEINAESALVTDQLWEVTLDRPFVYALVDLEHQMPLFLGTVLEV